MNRPTFIASHQVVDRLAVEIHPDRRQLGVAAARATATWLRHQISRQGSARVGFACAPSQDEFLAALIDPAVGGEGIDWTRVTAFHLDEYVGLPATHPQSFRAYLQQHLLRHVPIGRFHAIPGEHPQAAQICTGYSGLLQEAPLDLICLGIGENGHLAFNDPSVADFNDPVLVKRVELDQACRQQQVNDGGFASLDEVPRSAYTLTLPVFRQARRLQVQVPGPRKAAAVRATLTGPIDKACPASILRVHPSATLYLDVDSASQLVLPP